jgi:hypothetical protein
LDVVVTGTRQAEVVVRIGDLVVRERRGQRQPDQVTPSSATASPAAGAAAFPRMAPIDPDSVALLTRVWARSQEDEPRSLMSPWLAHTCHGRLSAMDVAELHGNLVVRYKWSEHGSPVYSLFGRNELERTAVDLLAGISELGHDPIVEQISERQATELRSVPSLRVARQPERDEYVLDAARHAALDGHSYKRLRYSIRHLTEQHHGKIAVRMVDSSNPAQLAEIEARLVAMPNSSWRTGNDEDAWESACLSEFLRKPMGAPVKMFVITIAGSIRGIGVFEVAIGHDAAVFHILRTDSRFEGLVDFGIWALAHATARQGLRELNLEEDLGIPGLRRKKEHQHPSRMITAFTLRPAEETV